MKQSIMVTDIDCTYTVYVNHYDGQYYYRRLFSNGWALTGSDTYHETAAEAVAKMIAKHLQQNMNTYMMFSCSINPITGEYDIDADSVMVSDEYHFQNRNRTDDDSCYGSIPYSYARQYQE